MQRRSTAGLTRLPDEWIRVDGPRAGTGTNDGFTATMGAGTTNMFYRVTVELPTSP